MTSFLYVDHVTDNYCFDEVSTSGRLFDAAAAADVGGGYGDDDVM
jgi:hypothetical protein